MTIGKEKNPPTSSVCYICLGRSSAGFLLIYQVCLLHSKNAEEHFLMLFSCVGFQPLMEAHQARFFQAAMMGYSASGMVCCSLFSLRALMKAVCAYSLIFDRHMACLKA